MLRESNTMATAKNTAQQPTNQNESDDDDDENEDKRRNRAPSPFHSQSKVTISVHEDLTDEAGLYGDEFQLNAVSTFLANHFNELGFATRLVSRKRAEAKVPGIPGAMLYIAAKGYEFPASAERGIRLDSETANEIKEAAAVLGIDVNDKDALIKMLRSLAAAAKKSANK